MRIQQFAAYLKRLEETSKRLEITTILTELISNLDSEESDIAIYLTLGYLKAPFENVRFNIADKLMAKILEVTFASPENPNIKNLISSIYQTEGDLGNVAFNIQSNHKGKNPELLEIYDRLMNIAKTAGTGSAELKVKKTADLLKICDKLSSKYLVRIILGNIRLGFTELTIVDALANYLGNKSLANKIEAVYNIHPDIGLITKQIKKYGEKGIDDIKIEAGVPVLSQKAQRVSGMEEAFNRIKPIWAEFKFDGTRVQLHFDKSKKIEGEDSQNGLFDVKSIADKFLIKTYTRNLEETTHQYPDLVEAAIKQINAESVVLDGEAIGYNKETGEFLPFQETIQRKRKYDVTETAKNIPLKYFVFDILYLNGKSLINKPLKERREILNKIIKPGNTIIVDEHLETEIFEELVEYFEIAKEKGLEGLLVKNPADPYQAGARSYSWIKLKKADENLLNDSLDCVVLGYYYGKGVRSKFGIGGFLVGVYDKETDTFKTITKIGTGLKEDDFIKLKQIADKVRTEKPVSNVEINKALMPDVATLPKIVVEVGADEISVSQIHTAGYALRFPRLLKFREDKNPTQATSLSEVIKLFNFQRKI